MMKFWAKVRFKGEENASNLIRAFFKEFNPESSIVIRGKEVRLEIFFDNAPPMQLVEAVSSCEVIEFNFGRALGEYEEDQSKQELLANVTSEQPEEEEVPLEDFEQTEEEETLSQASEQTEAKEALDKDPEQTEEEEKLSEDSEHTEAEEAIPQEPKKKRGRKATTKVKQAKAAGTEPINLPQLEEIAKKSTSFEHFVKLVAEWLEMDKRQSFFENLVIVASEATQVSWKELEKALKSKGVFYSQWDKIWTVRNVSEKLEEHSMTILPLLEVLVQYKNYSFGSERPAEEIFTEPKAEEASVEAQEGICQVEEQISAVNEVSTGESPTYASESANEIEETHTEVEKMLVEGDGSCDEEKEVPTENAERPDEIETIPAEAEDTSTEGTENQSPKMVRMECMPEIPEFEEALTSLDRTLPIEDRVKYVLTAMGWKKQPACEQQEIFEIAYAAVRVRKMTFVNIFRMAGFPSNAVSKERMTFSKFVNDFVNQHNPDQKVRVMEFLKQLQKVIMLESEIETLADLSDETL